MGDPSGFFLFMLLPPLLLALIIQFFVSPRKRAKVIVRTALGWTAAIALTTTVTMVTLTTAYADEGLFRLIVNVVVIYGVGLTLALIGAMAGSELSTLLKRLFRKATD